MNFLDHRMRLVEVISSILRHHEICILSWRRSDVDWKARHPPTMSCLIINAMRRHPAQVMAILIRISQAMEHVVDRVEREYVMLTIRINLKRHPRLARRRHACCWSMKCICAIRWQRAWMRNRTACIHSKLFCHKVCKIWVTSKLPHRPVCVNWLLLLFLFPLLLLLSILKILLKTFPKFPPWIV